MFGIGPWLAVVAGEILQRVLLLPFLLGTTVFLPLVSTSSPPGQPEPLCRFGVNGSVAGYDVTPLRLGWYIDYFANSNPARPNGAEYAPMVRIRQTGPNSYVYAPPAAEIQNIAASNPGADWFVANEPDRKIYQDALDPRVYARAYHDIYQKIKAADPTARVFAGSIVQPTPLRLQYLDLVLQNYQDLYGRLMPVDGWAIHNFLLNEKEGCPNDPNDPETYTCWGAGIPPGIDATEGLRLRVADNDDIDLFKEQIERFRRWMAARGYRDYPLYVSEYGVLFWMYEDLSLGPIVDEDGNTFSPERVNTFMSATFDYMLTARDPNLGYPADDNRLVQRFSWYSVTDQEFNGFLFDVDRGRARTTMGDNYASYTAQVADQVDLIPVRLTVNPPAPISSGEGVTLTLSALVSNSGNDLRARTFDVRFYNGRPGQGGVPIGEAQTVSSIGCGETNEVTVTWPDVKPGQYQVYALVDVNGFVEEENESNNLIRSTVSFYDQALYAPFVAQGMAIFNPVD